MVDLIFPATLSRRYYFLRFVIYLIAQGFLIHWLFRLKGHEAAADAGSIMFGMILLALMFLFLAIVPRARDAGFSPWFVLLLFVPVVGTVFLLGLFVAERGWYQKFQLRRRSGA